jgi:hypothetical protein
MVSEKRIRQMIKIYEEHDELTLQGHAYLDALKWVINDNEPDSNVVNPLLGEVRKTTNGKCKKSPDGKHHFVLPPDSFDSPYCKYCYKGS